MQSNQPRCVPLLAGAGVGRGRGARPQQQQQGGQAAVGAAQQLRVQHDRQDAVLNKYIPGLHQPGVNYPQLPANQRKTGSSKVRNLPDELIKGYHNGSKNPISAVNEFAQLNRLTVDFKEVEIPNPTYYGQYAYQCILDGKLHPPGVGRTKKDAKTKSASVAFDVILAVSVEEEDVGDVDVLGGGDGFEEVEPTSSADQYGLGNKHPVMMLHEYCGKKGLECDVRVHDKATEHGFQCDVFVGARLVTTAYSNNKKDAKKRAGEKAIKILLAEDVPSQTQAENSLHFDIMRDLAREKIQTLREDVKRACGAYGNGRYAAFIVKRSPEDRGEVVAVGTGEGCITGKNLRLDGKALIDCHAEVIARRALVKWFYMQVNLAFAHPDQSIFELADTGTKLRLKMTVSIHLYLSGGPCGDVTSFHIEEMMLMSDEVKQSILSGLHIPKFDDSAHGLLRLKLEYGATSVPVLRVINNRYSLDDVKSGEIHLHTMSCSDKLLKWNVLGVQGSLLSTVVEPIYINSVTLGNQFDHGHLVRGICCRLPDGVAIGGLPEGFEERHPIAGRVSCYEPVETVMGAAQYLSVNWCAEDAQVEVIDSRTGLSIAESPFRTNISVKDAPGYARASRLCKAGFSHRFKTFAKDKRQHNLLAEPVYAGAKRLATDYQAVKERLYLLLEQAGFGSWQRRFAELQEF